MTHTRKIARNRARLVAAWRGYPKINRQLKSSTADEGGKHARGALRTHKPEGAPWRDMARADFNRERAAHLSRLASQATRARRREQ